MNAWIYIFILIGGVLQACGAPMNGQLFKSLGNPWLSSLISFATITALFLILASVFPRPLPTLDGIRQMPWWAPLGGIVGAVAVYAGLTLVGRVGAGPYTALTVCAALVTSIAIDHFGLFGAQTHHCGLMRSFGTLLMIGGVVLVTRN